MVALDIAAEAEGVSGRDVWCREHLDGIRSRLGGLFTRLQIPETAILGTAEDYYQCFASYGSEDRGSSPPGKHKARKKGTRNSKSVGSTPRSSRPEADPKPPIGVKTLFLQLQSNDPPLRRLQILAFAALWQCKDGRLDRDNPPLTRRDVATVCSRVRDAYIDANRMRVEGKEAWARAESLGADATPFDMLRMCIAALHAPRYHSELEGYDVDALMLLGASARSIQKIRGCRLCFRWAMPGHPRCARHSQSKEAGGSRRGRQTRYEGGRAILALAHVNPPEQPRRMFRSYAELVRALSQVVWPSVELEEVQGGEIALRLRRYPRVAKAIGFRRRTMTGREIIGALRNKIDPLEYRPEAWKERLGAAEIWLRLEQMPTRQRAAWVLSSEAIAVLPYFGKKPRRRDVAAFLGLSQSAFSHLLSRRQDVPTARRLAALLRGDRDGD